VTTPTWRDAARWGALGGITAVFIAVIGMAETFDARKVVDPFLSLGYLSLLWIPVALGYRVSRRVVLEGAVPIPAGVRDVVLGTATGAIVAGILCGFILLIDAFELRSVLVNVTPTLGDYLTGGRGLPGGLVLVLGVGSGLGALGGAMHLLPSRLRSLGLRAGLWIVVIGLVELLFGSILREVGLKRVDSFLFNRDRTMPWYSALLVALAVIVPSVLLRGRVQSARARFSTMPAPGRRRVGFALAAAAVVFGMIVPVNFGPLLNEVLATVGLFMLMGLGLNIVVGYAGLLDLGYVAFFAVGAYSTAILTSAASPKFTPELAFFAAVPFVILIAALAGLVVGTPVIRMRGDYLAIVTLAFGEIARLVFQADWLKGAFGGAQGLRIDPARIRTLFGYVLAGVGVIALLIGLLRWWAARSLARERGERDSRAIVGAVVAVLGAVAIAIGLAFPDFATWTARGIDTEQIFRFVLVFVAIAAFVSWRLEASRVGRAWMALREDEHVAEAMGINVVTAKLTAFVTGAVLAALGGALFAVKIGTIYPSSFRIVQSIIILVIVIVGGMGSLRGVALGALVLIGVLGGPTQPGLLREFEGYKLLIYGVLLIVMMLKRPEGLLPAARRTRELHQEEFLQDAWIKAKADEMVEGAD
jgi:branched-chain amino acid transport system permease protein